MFRIEGNVGEHELRNLAPSDQRVLHKVTGELWKTNQLVVHEYVSKLQEERRGHAEDQPSECH
jgi:hypothetical protein